MRRALLLASLCWLTIATAHAQPAPVPVDEAARTLAKRVAAHLEAHETVHLTAHNLSALPALELSRAQSAFTRAIRRTGRTTVEVTLTISENTREHLLIAETKRPATLDWFVDMTAFDPTPPRAAAAARPAIQKTLLWEQDDPVLDLQINGDHMLVLEPGNLVHYQRVDGKWVRGDSTSVFGGNVRDPRGQIGELEAATLLGPGNTFPGESGGPAYYTRVHWKAWDFAAESDGLVHVYDAAQKQVTTIDQWGSDLAATACAVLATGPGDAVSAAAAAAASAPQPDSIAAWDLVDRRPRRISDPLDFAGPVTALWPRPEGALAVVHEAKRYAAYLLTLDCGR